MSEHGFFSLGQILGGGDPRPGEKAFLEGLDTGSRIRARNASTESAIQQARTRRNKAEAQEELKSLAEELGIDPGDATLGIAGLNPEQFSGAALDRQGLGFRKTIADVGQPFDVRQAAAQAANPSVVDPFQFGPGGELATDVFNPDLQVTETGEAQIGLDVARTEKARQDAALAEAKRLNPDHFKSSAAAPSGTLAEEILPGGAGTTIIPEDLNAEEAFGAEAFFKGAANAFTDFVGLGTFLPEEAKANTVLRELSARTQIVLRADVPGGRPPVIVQELLARYAEDPRQLFRGDDLAVENLTSTLASLRRGLQRTKDRLNSPSKKTPTSLDRLEAALFSTADLVADYEAILKSVKRGRAGELEQPLSEAVGVPDGDFSQVQIGGQIQLPGGGTATRIE